MHVKSSRVGQVAITTKCTIQPNEKVQIFVKYLISLGIGHQFFQGRGGRHLGGGTKILHTQRARG